MKQPKRVFYFFIGILLGTVIALSMFGNRDIEFNYLPNARVTNHLSRYPMQFSDKASCQMECLGKDSLSMVLMVKNASVDFAKSQPRPAEDSCKFYWLTFEATPTMEAWVQSCDTLATIEYLVMDQPCDC